MLAVTAILGMVKSVAAVTLVVPIFALGLPIFDTTFAIIRRFINKKPIMEADKDHLHHKLMGKGLNQRQTVLVMYLISMMLGLAAVIVSDSDPATGIIVVGFVIVIVLYLGNKIGLFAKKLEK
jgi:UDP-GlcNAc:undecaprenyl-phosphate/decaprenyl-phosphate GlcNAc-1-phosphate transferase